MKSIKREQPIYECGECHKVYLQERSAEICCASKTCEDCGCELPHTHYFVCCDSCREKRILDRAEKLTIEEYASKYPHGYVVLCDTFYGDVYEAMEQWEYNQYPNEINDEDRPQYCFGTTEHKTCVDFEWAIESALEDAYEDAEYDDKALKELSQFMDKWNKENALTYYCENDKVIVLLDWSKHENRN